MRFSPNSSMLCGLLLAVAGSLPTFAQAELASPSAAWTAAQQGLEIATLEWRLYRQVEYPRELRRLLSKITLTEAEIKTYRLRLREYGPMNRFSLGKPLFVSLQNTRLHLLEAELRLQDLTAERLALRRFRSDRCRLLELRVLQSRARLAQIALR